jgi:hypothetical protein
MTNDATPDPPVPGSKEWAYQSSDVFVKHTLELLESPAYRTLPWKALKALRYFEVQHLKFGGERNGSLPGSHRQLIKAGIDKGAVTSALRILIEHKLLVMTRKGSYLGNGKGYAALFGLTYLPTRKGTGDNDYEQPKHDWRQYQLPRYPARKPRVRIEYGDVLPLAANDG